MREYSTPNLPDKKKSIYIKFVPEFNISDYTVDNYINGALCNDCREVIEKELGNNIFYLMALCNTLNINLYDVIIKEYNKVNTLGKFNLT